MITNRYKEKYLLGVSFDEPKKSQKMIEINKDKKNSRPQSAVRRSELNDSQSKSNFGSTKTKISIKLAPIDPSLYKVDMTDVKKQYEKIKSSQKKNKPNIPIKKTSSNKSSKLTGNRRELSGSPHNKSIVDNNISKEGENSYSNLNNTIDENNSNLYKRKFGSHNKLLLTEPNFPTNRNENMKEKRGININKLSVVNISMSKDDSKKSLKMNSKYGFINLMKRLIPIKIDKEDMNYKDQNKNTLKKTIKKSIIIKKMLKNDKNKNTTVNNKEAMVDKSKCVLCLKRVTLPVTLRCKHEMCLDCAKEVKSLYEFLKEDDENFNSSFIRCTSCSEKTILPDSKFDTLLRSNWIPLNVEKNESNISQLNNVCEICPSSKAVKDFAEFECLNCDILICYECKLRHVSNPRHHDHKIIQVVQLVQEKIELTLCEIHREPMKLYCITENKACCIVCSNYENGHEGHIVKSIRSVIENSVVDLSVAIRECEQQLKTIESSITQMLIIKQTLENEHKVFLDKLNNTCENLIDMIKNRQQKINDFIKKTFDDKLKSLIRKLSNFTLISNRYNHFKTIVCDRDIDIIDRINQLKLLNEKIHKLEEKESLLWNAIITSDIDSLKSSIFVDDPREKIEKSLEKFNFMPLTQKHFNILNIMFKESNIIKKESINSDLLMALPRIKSGCLLYKISRDGPSTELFHKLCDNKGPTILLVKTDDDHIFGGYNPVSWINEYMYNETEEAFLFSLTDGNLRKPIRCPVKKSLTRHKVKILYAGLKKFAIKQNETDYSPGFGETDQADLLISFKNLNKSYSQLGNVYKCPRGYNPKEFFAGRPSDWKIADVEAYAIEVMTANEYYEIIRN